MLNVPDLIRALLAHGLTPDRVPSSGETPAHYLQDALLGPFLTAHLPGTGGDAPSTGVNIRMHEGQLVAFCSPETFNVYCPDLSLLLQALPEREHPVVISTVQRVADATSHVAPMYFPRAVSEAFSQCGDWREWTAMLRTDGEYGFDPDGPDADERAEAQDMRDLLVLMRRLRAFTDHDDLSLDTCRRQARSPLARALVKQAQAVVRLAAAIPQPSGAALTLAHQALEDVGEHGARVAWLLGVHYGAQSDVALEALGDAGQSSMAVGAFPPLWAARLNDPLELGQFVRGYRALDDALVSLAKLVLALEEEDGHAETRAA